MNKWSGKFFLKYEQLLNDNNYHLHSRDNISDEVKHIINGAGFFIDNFEKSTKEAWQDFYQQIGLFFLSEEYLARPGISIIQLLLADEDKNNWKQTADKYISCEPFSPFQRVDLDVFGYSGNLNIYIYPLLKLVKAYFKTDDCCSLILEYDASDLSEIPDTFHDISFYLDWPFCIDETYELIYFFHNSTCKQENIYFNIPTHTFAYPKDKVSLPYDHSWNYLKPYPYQLDFFIELSGLTKEHFVLDNERKKFKCQLDFVSKSNNHQNYALSDNFDEINENLFNINALPVYHWVEEHIESIRNRDIIPIMKSNLDQIIRVKLSKDDEFLPVPYYFPNKENEYVGYYKFDNNYAEVNIFPVEANNKPFVYPLHLILAKDYVFPNENEPNHITFKNYLQIKELFNIKSIPLKINFKDKDTMSSKKFLFMNRLRSSLKLWDKPILLNIINDYLSMHSLDYTITIGHVYMRYIVEQGTFPVLPIHITGSFTPKTWFVLSRLYQYLKERSPIFFIPCLIIIDTNKEIQREIINLDV